MERHRPLRSTAAAMLVLDMQNDTVHAAAAMFDRRAQACIEPTRRMLELARATGIRVIFTAHAHRASGCDMGTFVDAYPAIREGRALIEGTCGAEICDEVQPLPGETVVRKRRHSAFFGTDLDLVLRSLAVDTVVVTGDAGSSWAQATVRDASAHGYRAIVIGHASVEEADGMSVDEFANLVMSERL
jgi:biuret amidohydrolase